MSTQREEFEKWIKLNIHLPNLLINKDGEYAAKYQSTFMEHRWEAWKAAQTDMQEQINIAVAAAYEDAGRICTDELTLSDAEWREKYGAFCPSSKTAIRSRTPADAQKALDAAIKAAKVEVMEQWDDLLEDMELAGMHDSPIYQKGKSNYNRMADEMEQKK
jgi:hypothetical protein